MSSNSVSNNNRLQTQCNSSKTHRSSRARFSMSLFLSLLCIICVKVNGMSSISKPDMKMSPKRIFINELNEARSGNPILSNKNPKNLDILLDNMINENPTPKPSSTTSLLKFSKGKWGVVYAPHIKTLGKVLLSNFSVFYEFYDIADSEKQGIVSNVMYESKVFGRGWLNTQGS